MKKTKKKITSLEGWENLKKNDPDFIADKIMTLFVEELSQAMIDRKVSRSMLAKKLKCSSAYITKLLRGEENLTIKKISYLACVLQLTPKISLEKESRPLDEEKSYVERFVESKPIHTNKPTINFTFYSKAITPATSFHDFNSEKIVPNNKLENICYANTSH